MRDEDVRGGSNLISRDGRGPLSFGEQQALAMQSKNRRLSEGDPNEVRQRQAAAAVDTAMKAPRGLPSPWIKDPRGQG
jgi:hypothetical protein